MIAIMAVGILYTLLFFILSIGRLLYPYEIEFSEGTVLEHAVRIFQHKPLFTAPSISFVDLQYQPLYYYVTVGAMHLFGINYFSGRIVSFSSAILCAVLIFYIVYNETRSWNYSFIGLSLFFAAYGVTGYWYELARVDSLMVLFLVASIAFIRFWENRTMTILSAFVLALGFFTKQELIFYFVPGFLWVFLNDKRRAILYAASSLVFLGLGIFLFTQESGRWYWYFTFALPAAAGRDQLWYRMWGGTGSFLFTYYSAGALLLLYFGIFAWRKRNDRWKSPIGLILLFVITAIIQLALQSAHSGSYKNAAMPLAAIMAIAVPVASFQLWNSDDVRTRKFVVAALLIQFFGLFYSFKNVPLVMITQKDRDSGAAFLSELKQIPGTVFVPGHSFLSTMAGNEPFANIDAIEDCGVAADSTSHWLQAELREAFAAHRFDAIIMDDGPHLPFDSIPGYTLAREINRGPHPFVTRMGDALYIPRYVYLPKNE